MIFFKLFYHLNAIIWMMIIKTFCYFWGGKITFGKHVTFRKGFSIMIAKHGMVSIR